MSDIAHIGHYWKISFLFENKKTQQFFCLTTQRYPRFYIDFIKKYGQNWICHIGHITAFKLSNDCNIYCGIGKQAFCNCCLNHFLSHDCQLIITSGCISTATCCGSVMPTELMIPPIHLLPPFPSGVSGAQLVAGLHVILLNRDRPLSESAVLAFKQTTSPVLFSALDTIIRIVTLSLPSPFFVALCSS